MTDTDLDPGDYDLYAGFYQGLAWAQSAKQGPLQFAWPDELMRQDALAPLTFRRPDFFAVVADLDDGDIHRWETSTHYGATLYCTEDPIPTKIPKTARYAYLLRGD
jgi:hypothetical protein